ncbi:putative monooxygenase [Cercophora newfieldiana]|uniref:Monooxygenase n=1 Tax=Cercophora newfieldiana TaxID=92897 RepID=A0AA40CJK5_9PEZI|nr:putative monooxygenase [Cercophora newfieldiana]
MSKTKFLIVGTGFGGIEMAVALQKAGIDDYVMLEKGADIGGVWRDNSYPGCSCDIPSHLYSFSFAPYKGGEKRFPPQRDILAYLRQVATDFQLWPHVRLNTAVVQAVFQEDTNRWEVTTSSSETYDTEHVIFAVGQLHRPHFADIPGRKDFLGPQLHPAVWDHNIDLRDKNIAIIGTGSSAAQMLPSLASVARSVTLYQRTPAWILPKPSPNFGRLTRWTLHHLPGAHALYRTTLSHAADLLLAPLPRTNLTSKPLRLAAETLALCHLHIQVPNRTLRHQLTPSYPIGTKRILFDSHFYPALSRPNVHLVTDPISHITPTDIVTTTTANGAHHPADIIIFATGFKASEFLAPISILGRNGRSLSAEWACGGEAFLGVAMHGYPNAFVIAGPNSFNPAGSNPGMKEVQVEFIMRCLKWKGEVGAGAVEVRGEVVEGYKGWLGGRMGGTVWRDSEVGSWYRHASGKVTGPWPASGRRFRKVVRGVSPGEAFEVVGGEGC